MRVLCIIPPHVPSYFNAGHHLTIFEIAAYLRKNVEDLDVIAIDGAALNLHWRRMCDVLHAGFDLIAVMVDYDGIDPLRRFISYTRELSPQARILAFGRMTYQVPGFFENYDLDAIVESGDPEPAVAGFINYLRNGTTRPAGVRVRGEGFQKSLRGAWLPSDEWVLPDVSEIPYDAYDRMYERDLDKFCGIPERRELVVPVARGCPVGCAYCDVPVREGKIDRWLAPEAVVSYIDNAFRSKTFDYVSFYAPTFTLRREWVIALCSLLEHRPPIAWKCTTTLFHLDAELIEIMAARGCIRISVGLETLGNADPAVLPRIKRDVSAKFDVVADACNRARVELNCFVILGLPGDSVEGVAHTIERVLGKGARVRPTIYTPYQDLKPHMSEGEASSYNRQLFAENCVDVETARMFYALCYGNKADKPTRVMESIAQASLATPAIG